uniref:Uncharacterized protein n=1 Tax=Ditylenchus dipsaci TaxID=166011 RepID=A0A915CZE1_9BILA
MKSNSAKNEATKNQLAMNQRFGEEKARVSIIKFVNARADAESYRQISIDAQSKFSHFMKTKDYGDLFKGFVNTMIEQRNAQMTNEQAMTSAQSLQYASEGLGLNSEDQDQKQDSQQTTSSKSDMNKVGEDRSKKVVTAEVYCEPKKEQNELSGQSSLSKSSDQADAQLYLQQANTEISILKAQKHALEVTNGNINAGLEAEVEFLREKVKDLAAIEAKNAGLEAQVRLLKKENQALSDKEAAALMCMAEGNRGTQKRNS